MIKYEWRNVPFRDHDPIIAVEGTHNFRSVYGYPPDIQEHIAATNLMVGIKSFAVQSSTLFIDVDEEEHLEEIERIIAAANVGYSVWTTGNRGLHFHIDMDPDTSIDLPYSQAEYIRGLGLGQWVDMSIYRHHSIIRTPGAVHASTGKRKEVLRTVDGPMLRINLVQEPEPEFENHEEGDSASIRRFKCNLIQKRGVGQRHMHLFILFNSGINAGHDIDTMLDWLQWWNNHQADPHSVDTVYTKWKGFVNGKTQGRKTYQSKSVLSF